MQSGLVKLVLVLGFTCFLLSGSAHAMEWVKTTPLSGVNFVYSIDEGLDGAIYAGTNNGRVQKSIDLGATWNITSSLTDASDILSVYQAPDEYLYAAVGTSPEVLRSSVPVPEPSSMLLVATGAVGMLGFARRFGRRLRMPGHN